VKLADRVLETQVTGAAAALPEMVDIAFGLAGENLPQGFEWPLFREIVGLAPWIARTPRAGILPLRGTRAAEGATMITHRTRLVLRLPRDRVCSASAIEHKAVTVCGARIALGSGVLRHHQAAATLYSPRVTTGEADEVRFLADIEAELAALGVRGRLICGRRVDVDLEEGRVAAFPLAIHGLRDADSLLLQRAGLGRGQPVGCGLPIPHKTIVAAD
jgi:CRISPR-associated protein Cas6